MKTASEVQQYCWKKWGEAEREITKKPTPEALSASEFWRGMYRLFEDRIQAATASMRRDELAVATTDSWPVFNQPPPPMDSTYDAG